MGESYPCVKKRLQGTIPCMGDFNRARLKELIKERGTTPRAISRAVGDNPYLVRDILNAKSKNPRSDTISKIAEILDVSFSELMDGADEPDAGPMGRLNASPALRMLPIRFRVQAGAWLQADVYATQDYGEGPTAGDPRIAPESQWLEEVVGESMNNVIKPGWLVHVVDAVAIEYTPRDGDIVVVERTRHQGAEIERSLKRVHIKGRRIELRGDSSVAEFNRPLSVEGDGEDVEIRIAGWVKHSIQRH